MCFLRSSLKRDFFPKQHNRLVLYNRHAMCFLWGRNTTCKCRWISAFKVWWTPSRGEWPVVVRPLLSLKRRTHFKPRKSFGKNKNTGPETKIYYAGEDQQQFTLPAIKDVKRWGPSGSFPFPFGSLTCIMNMCPFPNGFWYLARSILNLARNIFLPSRRNASRSEACESVWSVSWCCDCS
jgi:hypothetical protein